MLGADEPALWYEALAALPPLPDAGSAAPLTPEQVEARRAVAEQAMEAEAAAFEQAFGAPLPSYEVLAACKQNDTLAQCLRISQEYILLLAHAARRAVPLPPQSVRPG